MASFFLPSAAPPFTTPAHPITRDGQEKGLRQVSPLAHPLEDPVVDPVFVSVIRVEFKPAQ